MPVYAPAEISTIIDKTTKRIWHDKNIELMFNQDDDCMFSKIAKEEANPGEFMIFPVHTSGNNRASTQRYNAKLATAGSQVYNYFTVTETLMTQRINIWAIQAKIASAKGEASVIDLVDSEVTNGLKDFKRQMDKQLYLSDGAMCVGRITASASSATHTCDWVKNDATYSGWSGSRMIETDSWVVLIDGSGNYLGNKGYTVSSVDAQAGTVTFSESVNTASGPWYIFQANDQAYSGDNDFRTGFMGFRGIADEANPKGIRAAATVPAAAGGYFQGQNRSTVQWARGNKIDGGDMGGVAGTAQAADFPSIVKALHRPGMLLNDARMLPDGAYCNAGVFDKLEEDLPFGTRFFDGPPDQWGAKDSPDGQVSAKGVKFYVRPQIPDNHLYLPVWKYLKYLYRIPPSFYEPGRNGKFLPVQDYLAETATLWTYGDFVSTKPLVQTMITDLRQSNYIG